MEYRQTINNEDNAMEIELDADLNGPSVVMSDENSVSQASTVPLGDEIIQINILHEEIGPHYRNYGTETGPVVSVTDRISPTLFQNENSNQSGNCSPSELHDEDSNESQPKKRHLNDESDEDEGKICPICLDNWTNTGDHRICSLKCGHLFGLSCINRWLSTETKKSCPTCKKKVNRHDIRHIYAKKLIAVDTTDLDILRNELTLAIEEKNRIQIELTKAVCKENILKQQLDEFKKKIQTLSSKLDDRAQCSCAQSSQGLKSQNDVVRLYMEKSLELSKDGGCRVLDCKSNIDLIVTSMKSSNSFFVGYGVRKISISNYKPTAFIGLHKSPIRDLKFHPYNSWLLSVSLDKVVKILDLNSNNQVASFTSTSPLWSCCWDADLSHILYVGEQQGSVVKYDIRQMAQPISVLSVPGDTSAVVSIAAIKQEPGLPVHFGGIIACKLNSMWVFENTPGEYSKHPLPIEGPFVSMSYQKNTRHMLVSARSNSKLPYARHVVCCINNQEETLKCDTIHSFPGGSGQKLLSRSCILSSKTDYVAAYQESQKSVYIWNVNTGNKSCAIPAHDPVLDLCGLQTSNAQFLLTLTEKKLEFFKFNN